MSLTINKNLVPLLIDGEYAIIEKYNRLTKNATLSLNEGASVTVNAADADDRINWKKGAKAFFDKKGNYLSVGEKAEASTTNVAKEKKQLTGSVGAGCSFRRPDPSLK